MSLSNPASRHVQREKKPLLYDSIQADILGMSEDEGLMPQKIWYVSYNPM